MAASSGRPRTAGLPRRLAFLAAAALALPVLAPLSEPRQPRPTAVPQPILRTVLPDAVPVTAGPVVSEPPPRLSRAAWNAFLNFRRYSAASGRPLGSPTSEVTCPAQAGACWQTFRGRVVLWHERTGARALRPEVFELWNRREAGRLGYPLTSEYQDGEVRRTDFERGSLVWDPRLQRVLEYVPGVEASAVIIGDSQAGEDTWLGQGVARLGYTPLVRGGWGTGYLNAYAGVDSYESALESGQWLLPAGAPGLVVLEGGGNDAAYPDTAIAAAARSMVRELRQIYPSSALVMVGVIGDGSGRRANVDRLLAKVAAEEGVPFISPRDWWKRHRLKLADGRHLSASGHAAAAPLFARELAAAMGR